MSSINFHLDMKKSTSCSFAFQLIKCSREGRREEENFALLLEWVSVTLEMQPCFLETELPPLDLPLEGATAESATSNEASSTHPH